MCTTPEPARTQHGFTFTIYFLVGKVQSSWYQNSLCYTLTEGDIQLSFSYSHCGFFFTVYLLFLLNM